MEIMDGGIRRTSYALSIWSLAAAILLLGAGTSVRAGRTPTTVGFHCVLDAPPCIDTPLSVTQSSPPPPAGEGSFRPGHFSMAPVIVAIERSRAVGRSRIGGLYGP